LESEPTKTASLYDEWPEILGLGEKMDFVSVCNGDERSHNIISEVLPYLINKDDGRINRATTTSKGKFCPSFSYLENFIRASSS